MKNKNIFWIFTSVVLFFIASAVEVSAQSNVNCSIYNRSEVPAGFVPLVGLAQRNNTHAQLVNNTDYQWVVACKSNVTNIEYGCTGTYDHILQLYQQNNSHVSVNKTYTTEICYNTSNTNVTFVTTNSSIGTVPEHFECLFSVSNWSDAHIYDCNYPGAEFNWNLRVLPDYAPTGSITIYGPNGTEITGTRNVYLNLTYTDDYHIFECRWANDNASNLNDALWENCTTVKPWILSEGEGNKTVYFQVKDNATYTTIYNDSIFYRFIQDYTSPSGLIVYDSAYGYDIDWWNSNTTISAYWWNATDDISTMYYKYRLLENSSCYNNDCNWTDTGENTSITLTNLSLEEGANYSFEIMVYTSSGFNTTKTSNGTIIDLTKPTVPALNSSTHPNNNIHYSNSTIQFNFTATDPNSSSVSSGILGYSYLLDTHPGTAPDDNTEDRYWETLSEITNDGYEQTLRANSSTASPHTYAVFSQLAGNFTDNESLRVRVALAERTADYDDIMDVEVYLISIANGGSITQFDNKGSAITTVSNISRDIKYSESMTGATIYEFNIEVNTTTLDTANDIYVAISGMTGDSNNRNNMSIAGSRTAIDNSTKNFVCNNANTCSENTTTIDYAIEVKREDSGTVWDVQYDYISDGTYYFHVKAKDRAGNWGDTQHFKAIIDTEGVTAEIKEPFTGQLFNSANITVSVETSRAANVSVIVLHPDGSNSTSDLNVVNTTFSFNATLENGINEIYARAVNLQNNVVSYSNSVFVRLGTDVSESNKTIRIKYSGAAALTNHIRGVNEGSVVIGIATENSGATFGADNIYANTSQYTIKIFATTTGMPSSRVESDLATDEFLDRTSPMFGYERGAPYNIVRTELRPEYIYFTGDRKLSSGNYRLVLKNEGTTADGKTNITVKIM
jgi:hypothetical protein